MATTKNTTKKQKPAVAEAVEKTEEKIEEVKEAKAKKPTSLPDYVKVVVQSNVYGLLIYINTRTRDKFVWDSFGDFQTLTIGDLRAMRGTQNKFFSNNYIFVDRIDDPDYEDVTPEEVYKALGVSQYYKEVLSPDNFNEIFTLSDQEMRKRILRLGTGAKTNIIVAANEAIKRGDLDSLRTVHMLEELLNCELLTKE